MTDEFAEIEAKNPSAQGEERIELIRALIADLEGPGTMVSNKLGWKKPEAPPRANRREGSRGVPGERVFENLSSRLER